MIATSRSARAMTIACLALITAFTSSLALQKVYDYDLWWHLRSGQWIVAQGAFPKGDPFSFSTVGADWTYLYGLADPLFYLLYQRFGVAGLQLFTTAIIAGSAVALFLFLTQRKLPSFGAALLVVWAVQIARFRFLVRPLVFKFAGIVFLFWFFYRRERFCCRYPLFFLVVLLWNWLYPAAFLAQIFAAFLLVEKLLERVCKSPRFVPGDLRDAFILLVLASLALVLNPNGFGLYQAVYGGFFADYAAGSYVVEEHQALVWSQRPLFAALVVSAGASFVAGRKHFRLLTLLIFAAFCFLAWGSVRYVGLAAFAMIGVIGVNLADLSRPAWLSWCFPEGRWITGVVGFAALTAGCFFLWQGTFQKTRVYEFGLGVKQSRYPYAAVQRLQGAGFSGNIYNSWKFGGFLEWHLPEAKTFIDGRCLPAQLTLYNRVQAMELHEFSRYLAENQVQAALLDRQDVRDVNYFTNMPGFRQVYADDLAVLLVREGVLPDQGGAARGNSKYLRLGGYEFEYLAPLAAGAEAPLVEAEILSAIKAAPDSFFENFLLGYFYEVRRDPRAAGQYLAAARKNPAFAFTHFDIGRRGGQAALKAGQWVLAAEIAGAALEYQKTGEHFFLLGTAQHQLKQLAAAEKAYRASLSIIENGRVRNNLGFLLLEMGQADKARESFAQGLDGRAGTDQEQSLYGLALALGKLQRPTEAAAVRARLAANFPQSRYLERLR